MQTVKQENMAKLFKLKWTLKVASLYVGIMIFTATSLCEHIFITAQIRSHRLKVQNQHFTDDIDIAGILCAHKTPQHLRHFLFELTSHYTVLVSHCCIHDFLCLLASLDHYLCTRFVSSFAFTRFRFFLSNFLPFVRYSVVINMQFS